MGLDPEKKPRISKDQAGGRFDFESGEELELAPPFSLMFTGKLWIQTPSLPLTTGHEDAYPHPPGPSKACGRCVGIASSADAVTSSIGRHEQVGLREYVSSKVPELQSATGKQINLSNTKISKQLQGFATSGVFSSDLGWSVTGACILLHIDEGDCKSQSGSFSAVLQRRSGYDTHRLKCMSTRFDAEHQTGPLHH